MSVHYAWAYGGKIVELSQSCAILLHLHALVQQRGHFMPPGVNSSSLVRALWTLPAAGSGLVTTPGSAGIASNLWNATHCVDLRKAAGSQEADKFSLC